MSNLESKMSNMMKKRPNVAPKAHRKRRNPAGKASKRPAVSKRHPLFGALKGLVRIAPGTDLTQPADPEWGDHERSPAAMTLSEFEASLKKAKPPASLAPSLTALWWAGKDDWEKAHRIVMHESGKDCAWVHAYLHRREGDIDNASYWYRQAGHSASRIPLADEWGKIAATLLAAS